MRPRGQRRLRGGRVRRATQLLSPVASGRNGSASDAHPVLPTEEGVQLPAPEIVVVLLLTLQFKDSCVKHYRPALVSWPLRLYLSQFRCCVV